MYDTWVSEGPATAEDRELLAMRLELRDAGLLPQPGRGLRDVFDRCREEAENG